MLVLALALGVANAHEGPPDRVRFLDARISEQPASASLHRERGEALRRMGRCDRALPDLAAAVALAPDVADGWFQLAVCTHELGDPSGAEALLDHVLTTHPHAEAHVARARLREGSFRLEEAWADWDAATRLDPTPDHVLARGRVAQRLGDWPRAIEGYREALGAMSSPAVHRALVEACLADGRPREAVAAADQLLAQRPDHPDWLLLRARALQAIDPAEAEVQRQHALTLARQRARQRPTALARVTEAEALAAVGRTDEARQLLTRVLADHPHLDAARRALESL